MLARQLGPRGGALHRAKAAQLAALRRWSRTGWYAYEEEAADAAPPSPPTASPPWIRGAGWARSRRRSGPAGSTAASP